MSSDKFFQDCMSMLVGFTGWPPEKLRVVIGFYDGSWWARTTIQGTDIDAVASGDTLKDAISKLPQALHDRLEACGFIREPQ